MFDEMEKLVREATVFPVNVVCESSMTKGNKIISVSYGTEPPCITAYQLTKDDNPMEGGAHTHINWPVVDDGQFFIEVGKLDACPVTGDEHDFRAMRPAVADSPTEEGNWEVVFPLVCKRCGLRASSEVTAADGFVFI